MPDKPPLISDDKILACLVKALKTVAELQLDTANDWFEDRINQTMEDDILRCKEAINTARKGLVKELFEEIEDCAVKDSPFPGFLVLKADKYEKVKEKFQ